MEAAGEVAVHPFLEALRESVAFWASGPVLWQSAPMPGMPLPLLPSQKLLQLAITCLLLDCCSRKFHINAQRMKSRKHSRQVMAG